MKDHWQKGSDRTVFVFYLFINVAETKCLSCQKALISGEENKITKSLTVFKIPEMK